MPVRRLPRCASLALLLAAACRPANPSPTSEILADCFWSADAAAWVDADGSGTREADEAPLAGVVVNFSLTFYSGATTGADGVARVSGMHPGACDDTLKNSLVAVAPEGYAPTTNLVLPYSAAQTVYEFGFQPEP